MSEKRYTPQELREASTAFVAGHQVGMVAAMLRQAADSEEELAQLKARLNVVVKLVPKERFMCEKTGDEESVCTGHLSTHCEDCDKSCYGEINRAFDAILRIARGEEGAEDENR